MKRVGRHLLNALTVLSMGLCAAVIALWFWPGRLLIEGRDWVASISGHGARGLWFRNPWSFYTLEWRAQWLSLFALVAALPAMRARRAILRRLARARAERAAGVLRCVKCGYDCRASPGRCPECGTIRRGRTRQPWER